MSECLAPEEIDAFLAGRLSRATTERVEAHVDKCTTCRQLIGKVAQATEAPELAETLASAPSAEALAATVTPSVVYETLADRPSNRDNVASQVVDRYVIKRRLGAGGMGVVYLAADPELGRDVAIKVLKHGAEAERLRREAQALAKLNHPNVVTVYDVGEHDGGVFIAMALVDGQNLREWLATDHTTEEILGVLATASRGIIAAHRAGMIHRDLKPDNIFVARDGNVLVGDFGLARSAGNDGGAAPASTPAADSLTMTGSVLGTPAYMAPEQAAGEATEKSDQFSYCVMAWEALYGTRPFAGKTLEELITRVESGEIAKPKKRGRVVPERVRKAIVRGLNADPDLRFPSMSALVAALAPRTPRRWPWLAGGVAAMALGVTAFIVTRDDHDPEAVCAPTKTLLAGVWSPQRSAEVIKLLGTHLVEPDVAAEIAKGFATYATRWTEARHATCMDRATKRIPVETSTAQVRCLDVSRVYLEQGIDALLASKEYSEPATIWRRVASLPSVEACRGSEAIRLVGGVGHVELMRDVATATATTSALTVFEELRKRAEATSDQPAQLAIALAEARRALEIREPKAADAALDRALLLAETLDIPAARVRALAMSARSKCAQNTDASVVVGLADAASRRLREEHHALEIDELLDARAQCAFKASRWDEAATAYQKLVERMVARYGKDDLLQLEPRSMLVLAYQQSNRPADAAREDAEVQRLIGKVGGDKTAAAMAASLAATNAFQAQDLREAVVQLRRSADLWTAADPWGGADSPTRILKAQTLEQLATFHEIDGAWRAAVDTYDEILRLYPKHQADSNAELIRITALTYRGTSRLHLGDVDGAAEDLQTGLALSKPLANAELVAAAQLALGRIAVLRGEWRRGVEQIREGLATHAKVGEAAFRIGLAEAALAQAQWQLGDEAAARETARKAELDLSKGVDDAKAIAVAKNQVAWREGKLAEIQRWRDAHR